MWTMWCSPETTYMACKSAQVTTGLGEDAAAVPISMHSDVKLGAGLELMTSWRAARLLRIPSSGRWKIECAARKAPSGQHLLVHIQVGLARL